MLLVTLFVSFTLLEIIEKLLLISILISWAKKSLQFRNYGKILKVATHLQQISHVNTLTIDSFCSNLTKNSQPNQNKLHFLSENTNNNRNINQIIRIVH